MEQNQVGGYTRRCGASLSRSNDEYGKTQQNRYENGVYMLHDETFWS